MNKQLRAEMIKAMDILVQHINEERFINDWLMLGVADGDISYDTEWEDVDEVYYEDDETFADLMGLFLALMRSAQKGGLYCDEVLSK